MLPLLLALIAIGGIAAYAMSGGEKTAPKLPELPPGPGAPPVGPDESLVPTDSLPVQPVPVEQPTTHPGAPPPGVVAPVGVASGASSVTVGGTVDDAFDSLLATALASGDLAQLKSLAEQAEARGLLEAARSIRYEIGRLTASAPIPTPALLDTPKVADTKLPTGRAVLSKAANSRGADVMEWQRLIAITADGIFGYKTDKYTRLWQTAHGLVADGIVGPKTWAAAYAISPALAVVARPAVVVTTPTVRATIRNGSRGADVTEWQKVLASTMNGIVVDGIFGLITETATRAWQRTNGLTADGVVGPLTWAKAYVVKPALTVVPTVKDLPPVLSAAQRPTIQRGYKGGEVMAWQALLINSGASLKLDGDFGSGTEAATKVWQAAHGLVVDGIVGPKTWDAMYESGFIPFQSTPAVNAAMLEQLKIQLPLVEARGLTLTAQKIRDAIAKLSEPLLGPGGESPIPIVPLALPAPPESDARSAALELVAYLVSLGGLLGRGKEDKPKVSSLLSRLGVPDPKGLYGRDAARAVMQQGLVPMVPFYWPSRNTTQAKQEFLSLVQTHAGADPQRSALWAELVSAVSRS